MSESIMEQEQGISCLTLCRHTGQSLLNTFHSKMHRSQNACPHNVTVALTIKSRQIGHDKLPPSSRSLHFSNSKRVLVLTLVTHCRLVHSLLLLVDSLSELKACCASSCAKEILSAILQLGYTFQLANVLFQFLEEVLFAWCSFWGPVKGVGGVKPRLEARG
eukprot:TRINITY_DN3604_c0_g1_i5.p1 TRINITY_DN3604_c0_g1~~TRINITY_DN3604_c0_g1_i5.p1  ORF type:complete len:162 (-),score=2.97 TRINITY_DN3604_c0_g1_i5:233-718(-)